MRKLLALVVAVIMLLSLVACVGGEGDTSLLLNSPENQQSNLPQDEQTDLSDEVIDPEDPKNSDDSVSTDGFDPDDLCGIDGLDSSGSTTATTDNKKDTTASGRPRTTVDKHGNVIVITTTTKSTRKPSVNRTTSRTQDGTGKPANTNSATTNRMNNLEPAVTKASDAKNTTTTTQKVSASTTAKKTTTTSPIKDIVYTDGQPVTYNTAILFDEKHSSIDAQADTLRNQILNAADNVKASSGGTTYYVSYKGNDANDGLSPQTAWRSTDHVGDIAAQLKNNSTLLFERGGVYRGMMYVRSGMRIGAYGAGPKPQLYGSLRNYAKESLWQKTGTANVWRLNFGTDQGDVGNIIFNCGVKAASTGKRLDISKVLEDYDFYFDGKTGYLYLYLSLGNPGKLYKSIEIAAQGRTAVIRRYVPEGRSDNITIDNLCIRYANFGISLAVSSNITITNCEIGWIGGSMQTETVRYGNGIEIYSDQNNITVKNNWIYQCYDAGFTNQGGKSHVNVRVSNNLIEYCHYNIEVFASDGGKGVKDSVYENNILRFPGYGFGSYNRCCDGKNKNTGESANIRTGTTGVPSNNFVIRNNIFDGGKYNVIYCGALSGDRCPTFSGNTWVQTGNYIVIRYYVTDVGYKAKSGRSQEKMNESVACLDKSATVIYE